MYAYKSRLLHNDEKSIWCVTTCRLGCILEMLDSSYILRPILPDAPDSGISEMFDRNHFP